MSTYDIAEIEQLVDGKLPWPRVQEIMKDSRTATASRSGSRSSRRRVPWQEPILLPLTPALFIVQKGQERIIKCRCGQEFGDYRVNWKLEALIHVRDSEESLSRYIRGASSRTRSGCRYASTAAPAAVLSSRSRPCRGERLRTSSSSRTSIRSTATGWPAAPGEVPFEDRTLDVVRGWSA
jgi:hypothetical protein